MDGEVWGQVLLVNVRKEGWGGYTGWSVLQDLQNITHSGERPKDRAREISFEFCLTGEQYLYCGESCLTIFTNRCNGISATTYHVIQGACLQSANCE